MQQALCRRRILGHAKLWRYFRNLSNICHTAKCWIVQAGWGPGGNFSWRNHSEKHWMHATHSNLHAAFVISSHRDSGLRWKSPALPPMPHVKASAEWTFSLLLVNAPTMCRYASLLCHWRQWCHLSAKFVTAQGMYCHPKVSYLKWHSQRDKWQDAAPCTCSRERKPFGLRQIITSDTGSETHPLLGQIFKVFVWSEHTAILKDCVVNNFWNNQLWFCTFELLFWSLI